METGGFRDMGEDVSSEDGAVLDTFLDQPREVDSGINTDACECRGIINVWRKLCLRDDLKLSIVSAHLLIIFGRTRSSHSA